VCLFTVRHAEYISHIYGSFEGMQGSLSLQIGLFGVNISVFFYHETC